MLQMATDKAGLLTNRYRIERLLGTGGFARVYLAHDERLGRRVAVKELSTARLDDGEQATALALFEGEARMLAQLDHPGLAKVWDYFDHDGRAYLVMEYVPGPTLRELVAQHGGPLPEPLVIACALSLCNVLSYLHHHDPPIIFRDLKPGNVIVDTVADGATAVVEDLSPDELSLKLIDFGIARLFKPEQSLDTMIVGTPGYASPEQYGQNQTDARSDIYSLGATLYHLASGQPPNGLILPPLLEANPAASVGLARLIARATALKSADRYQSIEAMRRDLQALSGGYVRTGPPPVLSPRPTVPLAGQRPPAPSSAPSPAILAVVVLLILAVVGLGAFAVSAMNRGYSPIPRPTGAATGEATSVPISSLLPGATGQLIYGQYATDVRSCDIYAFDLPSQSRRRLVGDANNAAAVLSPDRQLLATTKNGVIYVGPISNPLERQISTSGTPARYAAFSPNGRQLAWTESPSNNGVYRLVISDLEAGATTTPGPNRLGWLTWSQRGITYTAQSSPGQPQDIFLLGEDGVPRNISNTADIEEDFPAWSADGTRLLFTASTPGNLESRQIWSSNANGGNRVQLTQSTGPHTNAVFSPDGNWIAYASRAGGAGFRIWAMRADGSEPRQLLGGDEGQFYLMWSE